MQYCKTTNSLRNKPLVQLSSLEAAIQTNHISNECWKYSSEQPLWMASYQKLFQKSSRKKCFVDNPWKSAEHFQPAWVLVLTSSQ